MVQRFVQGSGLADAALEATVVSLLARDCPIRVNTDPRTATCSELLVAATEGSDAAAGAGDDWECVQPRGS